MMLLAEKSNNACQHFFKAWSNLREDEEQGGRADQEAGGRAHRDEGAGFQRVDAAGGHPVRSALISVSYQRERLQMSDEAPHELQIAEQIKA